MTHRVILQRLAVQDLDDAFAWAARKAPVTAARWLDGLVRNIVSA
jgi:plasmid stabilization system protein ParE